MSTLLEKLDQISKSEYVDLDAVARQVAYGDDDGIVAEEIHQAIKNQGKDLEKFRKQVQLYRDRQRLRDEIAESEANERRREELRAQVEEANARLEAAVELHRQETFPLQSELEQLRNKAATQNANTSELLRTCPSFELKSRLAELRREQEQLADQNKKLADIRPGKLSEARLARQRGERNHPAIAAAEDCDQRWNQLRERQVELEQEVAETEREMIAY